MKNSLFERFKPKENKFFPLLQDLAQTTLTASALMVECVQSTTHSQAVDFYKKIKEQETLGDKAQNKIFEELNNTFITPFDREDINHLSSTMDDVTDLINSCAKRIMLYNPKAIPESALRLASLVREASGQICSAIAELNTLKKNPGNFKKYLDQLDDIENRADDVYEHFIIDLFENETDAIEIIKLKDILHVLERATDAAELVGKIIKTMIVKYS